MSKIRLDHIGIAVNNLEEGAKFWQLLGLVPDDKSLQNIEQGVNIMFFSTKEGDPTQIELLEPLDSDSPIAKFINKRGTGVQQLAFEVENISEMIAHLIDNNIQMIDNIAKSGSHGSKIAFVHPKSTGGVLVELVQKQKTDS
ncbi:MAG: methylmalonyl-CoA epimerase [Thermoplasmata archaeon]|nr:methylmalonyl-CoA epimerase [Thermoplasmata archaeon]|tara:strand:+ start:476 stop:901 length:426 start_codon:yes stop_codon:yes gene_type:complete